MSTREAIYTALIDRLKTLRTANGGPFITVTDEVQEVQRFAASLQPVAMLYETDESYDEPTGPHQRRVMECWIIIGVVTKAGRPGARALNPLIDAVETLLRPSMGLPFQTLNGLVHSVRIKRVEKSIMDFMTTTERQHSANILLEIISPTT